ncbi:hypothetical protein OQA88_649 [Cercophora sp. LCS_1]
MPEAIEGQHVEIARAICNGTKTWSSEEVMVHLFLFANNFLDDQDSRTIELFHQLGHDGLIHFESLLAMGPVPRAIRQRLFISALVAGDLPLVRLLVNTGVEVNTVIPLLATTPLEFAASMDDIKESLGMVSVLLNAGADPNFRHKSFSLPRHSPLDVALRAQGHMAVVDLLVREGARPSHLTIQCAIKAGDLETVEKILDAGADVNNSKLTRNGYRESPIALAIRLGHRDIVRLLTERGADVNEIRSAHCEDYVERFPCRESATVYDRWFDDYHPSATALSVAIELEDVEIVQLLLLQPGLDINKQPDPADEVAHVCPLLMARHQGPDDLVRQILAAGADVPTAERIGSGLACRGVTLLTALMRRHGKLDMELVDVLVSKGARLDHAVLEATRCNNRDLVLFFLSHGAPEKLLDLGVDETALRVCIERGMLDMARFLYNEGLVDPGRPTRIGHPDLVKFLGEVGLLVGVLRSNGAEIFARACGEHSEPVLRQLMPYRDDIDFSRSPDAKRSPYDTILYIAVDCQASPFQLRDLVERGARFGPRTLMSGMRRGQEVLEALLSSLPPSYGPADIQPGVQGPGALLGAVSFASPRAFQLLLHAVEWSPRQLGVALTEAIVKSNPDRVQALRQAGASLNEEASPWMEPLISFTSGLAAAVHVGNVELVVNLIKAGANVNEPADKACGYFSARSALQRAAEIGHLQLVDILLDAHADPNGMPDCFDGGTALQFAAIGGYLEIARKLVRSGADVNAAGSPFGGRTALQGAAGRYTKQCRKAVDLAVAEGHHALAEYIASVRQRRIDVDDPNDPDETGVDSTWSNSNRSSLDSNDDSADEEESLSGSQQRGRSEQPGYQDPEEPEADASADPRSPQRDQLQSRSHYSEEQRAGSTARELIVRGDNLDCKMPTVYFTGEPWDLNGSITEGYTQSVECLWADGSQYVNIGGNPLTCPASDTELGGRIGGISANPHPDMGLWDFGDIGMIGDSQGQNNYGEVDFSVADRYSELSIVNEAGAPAELQQATGFNFSDAPETVDWMDFFQADSVDEGKTEIWNRSRVYLQRLRGREQGYMKTKSFPLLKNFQGNESKSHA